MSRRVFLIVLYVIVLFVELYAMSNAYRDWTILDDWTRATAVLNILVAFGSILLAYWLYVDDERITELEKKTEGMGN